MNSAIQDRVSHIISEFSSIPTWQEKYKKIIELGKNLAPMNEDYRKEENKVKGCQSQVWLFATFDGERVHFHADSDASIVKGIIALLTQVYSGANCDEIITTKADFLSEIGLREHLSMSRANGLASMIKQIQIYGIAFKAKSQGSL